jgi:hypothetical protein
MTNFGLTPRNGLSHLVKLVKEKDLSGSGLVERSKTMSYANVVEKNLKPLKGGDMKKFSKLLLHIMDVEQELAKQLIKKLEEESPDAVLLNAAHTEVYKILQAGYDLLKDDVEAFLPEMEKPELQLIAGGKK